MKVGDAAQTMRIFSAKDLYAYETFGGHPTSNGQVPEPLLASLFSYLLGMELPGLGTNYLKQETEYTRAATLGETLRASVKITRIRPEKHLIDLETICVGSGGKVICAGRALVYIKDVK